MWLDESEEDVEVCVPTPPSGWIVTPTAIQTGRMCRSMWSKHMYLYVFVSLNEPINAPSLLLRCRPTHSDPRPAVLWYPSVYKSWYSFYFLSNGLSFKSCPYTSSLCYFWSCLKTLLNTAPMVSGWYCCVWSVSIASRMCAKIHSTDSVHCLSGVEHQ